VADISSSDLVVALVAGGFAIVGTLVGGFLTFWSSHRLERERQAFERQRAEEEQRRLAGATSTILRVRYLTAKRTVETAITTGNWWSSGVSTVREPTAEELKLIALYLSEEGWEAVEQAEFLVTRVEETRQTELAQGKSPTGVTVDDLKVTFDAWDKASLALFGLSKLSSPKED
jgi:hypothetical protein